MTLLQLLKLQIAAKLSISDKTESTVSDGGNCSASTLAVNSLRSLGVTSPYVPNKCSKICGIVLLNLLVPGWRSARIYLGSMAETIC